jgi:hypothetical protein
MANPRGYILTVSSGRRVAEDFQESVMRSGPVIALRVTFGTFSPEIKKTNPRRNAFDLGESSKCDRATEDATRQCDATKSD